MKKYFYEEFVRVDETFNKDKLDFYGEASPLSTEEQKEFERLKSWLETTVDGSLSDLSPTPKRGFV